MLCAEAACFPAQAVLVLMASCCVLTVAHMLHDRLLAQAQEMTLLGSHGARAAATHQARRAGPAAAPSLSRRRPELVQSPTRASLVAAPSRSGRRPKPVRSPT